MGTSERGDDRWPLKGHGVPEDPFLRAWLRNSPTRVQLVGEMQAQPGLHLAALARRIGVHPSTLDHHVDAMEHRGLVETEEAVRGQAKLCFLTPDKELWDEEERTRVLFGAGDLKHVANYVVHHPASTIHEIMDGLGLSEHAVRHHVEVLHEADLVRRERVGRPYGYAAKPVLEDWSEEVGAAYGRPWEEGGLGGGGSGGAGGAGGGAEGGGQRGGEGGGEGSGEDEAAEGGGRGA